MKNMTDARLETVKIFDELRAGGMKRADAKELNNTIGKIIGTTKVQLEYAALRKEAPEIPFLK